MEFKLLMEYNPESPSGLSWIETSTLENMEIS
jgi:hypothetical protein